MGTFWIFETIELVLMIVIEFELTYLMCITICLNLLARHIGVDYINHCLSVNECIIFQVKDMQGLASFPQASFQKPKAILTKSKVTRALRLCFCCLHFHPTCMD